MPPVAWGRSGGGCGEMTAGNTLTHMRAPLHTTQTLKYAHKQLYNGGRRVWKRRRERSSAAAAAATVAAVATAVAAAVITSAAINTFLPCTCYNGRRQMFFFCAALGRT